jgi:hypothetical protein
VSPHPTQVAYAPQPSPFWAGAGTLGVLLLSTITVIGGLLLTAILWLRPLFKVREAAATCAQSPRNAHVVQQRQHVLLHCRLHHVRMRSACPPAVLLAVMC